MRKQTDKNNIELKVCLCIMWQVFDSAHIAPDSPSRNALNQLDLSFTRAGSDSQGCQVVIVLRKLGYCKHIYVTLKLIVNE